MKQNFLFLFCAVEKQPAIRYYEDIMIYNECSAACRLLEKMEDKIMVKVLGLGDNVCDVYMHTHTMYPGGQALNVAVYARGMGAEAAFLGVHGKDEVAAHVQATLTEKGLDQSRSRHYEGENGFACRGDTSGNAHHIALRDTAIEKSFWEFLLENSGFGRCGKVGIENEKVIFCTEVGKCLTVGFSGCFLICHCLYLTSKFRQER